MISHCLNVKVKCLTDSLSLCLSMSLALWQAGSSGFVRAGQWQWQEGTSHEHHERGIKLHRWLRLQHLPWQPSHHRHYHHHHHHLHIIYTGQSLLKQALNLKLTSGEQINQCSILFCVTFILYFLCHERTYVTCTCSTHISLIHNPFPWPLLLHKLFHNLLSWSWAEWHLLLHICELCPLHGASNMPQKPALTEKITRRSEWSRKSSGGWHNRCSCWQMGLNISQLTGQLTFKMVRCHRLPLLSDCLLPFLSGWGSKGMKEDGSAALAASVSSAQVTALLDWTVCPYKCLVKFTNTHNINLHGWIKSKVLCFHE